MKPPRGAELESQGGTLVAGGVGMLNQLCILCYHELNMWPQLTEPEQPETP